LVWAHWVQDFRPRVIVVECVSRWVAWPVEYILADGWVCVRKIFCPSDLGFPIRLCIAAGHSSTAHEK